jgi:hypothetical protein
MAKARPGNKRGSKRSIRRRRKTYFCKSCKSPMTFDFTYCPYCGKKRRDSIFKW